MIGRAVDGATTRQAAGVRARLDGETLLADVRLASGFVPARIVGSLDGREAVPGASLAIALNGRIVATTRTYAQDGNVHFATLVPETAFRNGINDVDLFGVLTTSGALRLVRLGGTNRGAGYALSEDERSIRLPSGQRVAIAKGRLGGRVESSTFEGSTVRIRGWAADVQNESRVARVLLFAGGRLLFASETSVYRWDLGVSAVPGLQRIGFVAELPAHEVRGAELRVVAVRGNVASELEWPGRTAQLLAARSE